MFEWIDSLVWRQFLQITILIPIVILLVRLFLKRYPLIGYTLLLLVLLKTIVPPVWSSPTGIFCWFSVPQLSLPREEVEAPTPQVTSHVAAETFKVSAANDPAVPFTNDSDTRASDNSQNVSNSENISNTSIAAASLFSMHWPLIFWAAGLLSLLGYLLGKRQQLSRFHKDMEVGPTDQLLESVEIIAERLNLRRLPKVLVTQHPTVPFACGVFKPTVVLPAHVVADSTPSELQMILAHEMTHLRRGDTTIAVGQLAIQLIWWFHPLVWWLNKEIRRLREECCDVDVVHNLKCEPANYAHCLLTMLEMHQSFRAAPGLAGLSPFEVTSRRLQNIMRLSSGTASAFQSRISVLATITLCALISFPGAPLSATPSPSAAPADNSLIVSNETTNANHSNVEQPLELITEQVSAPLPTEKPPLHDVPRSENSLHRQAARNKLIPELSYKWRRDDDHSYNVKIEANYPQSVRTHIGNPTFHVAAYAAGIPAFRHLNNEFESVSLPRDGVTLPQVYGVEDPVDVSRFSRGPTFRSPFSTPEPTSSIDGSNAHVDPTSGELPYLLGNLEDWIFPSFPNAPKWSWQEQTSKNVVLTEASKPEMSSFSSALAKPLPCEIHLASQFLDKDEKGLHLRRIWSLKSHELADDLPIREVQLTDQRILDAATGMTLSANISGQLTERSRLKEVRIPLSMEVKRINPLPQ